MFAQVAEAQRLEVVVHLSQWVAGPDHPSVHAREKWLAARVFEQASGFDSIKIEPGWFADNYFAALGTRTIASSANPRRRLIAALPCRSGNWY